MARYLSVFGIPHQILLVEQAQTGLLFNKGTPPAHVVSFGDSPRLT
jgi:hypothetical protein